MARRPAAALAVLSTALVTVAATAGPGGAGINATAPGVAAAAHPTTLSTTDRLGDRRYVAAGTRAYDIGTEAGRYPAMGFHTRGEMGGVWSPPIKLLDGLWFGVDGHWVGPARRFTSGYGYVSMDLPRQQGLQVTRTDFVPDGRRAVLVGLRLSGASATTTMDLAVDAHSELMSAYPWSATTPNQETFNLRDTVTVDRDRLLFPRARATRSGRSLPRLGRTGRGGAEPGAKADRPLDRPELPRAAGPARDLPDDDDQPGHDSAPL